ncbi:MAG: TonB-dependent receptor, partial [candidate division KSB1 bacterium]|nr:TonB-dependent receptor [candidate division KSB1 bacterium]
MRKSGVVLIALLVAGVPGLVWAQSGKVVGKVTDMRTGAALPAANVVLQGTTIGAATNLAGEYVIPKAPLGTYQLRVSYIGYRTAFVPVEVRAGVSTRVDVQLEPEIISGATITVLADRAKIRETPVAFTDVRKEEMEARLGSQDIPLVLNTTPSVYATMQGGGAGDARVNVRGFNQRNVAIMINGVPVNDMENAWLYWSNWDGVADATSSIQIQRGLSAVNLATPSIGGTMNIITDPTATELGLKFKQEVGNDGFLKSTLIGNSGLIAGKYAFSAGVVRKVGDGVVDKTWTDAWAYYFGASWQINPNNRLELYALGAPQRHGQNSFRQNIGVYSEEF